MWQTYFVDLARYHAWANEIMFSALDQLSDEQRKADQGLFFRSIHHTVDHLLLVNRVWMGRLSGKPIAADFKRIHVPDWESLKAGLRAELDGMTGWLGRQDESWFQQPVEFVAGNGSAYSVPAVSLLTHMLTHFNHHRGQVSAVVTRFDVKAPEMDYLYYLRSKTA